MYNKVTLLGHLTRDVELRYTPSGTAVANTAIATSKKFKKQDGSSAEEVCFIDLAFFGRSAEVSKMFDTLLSENADDINVVNNTTY